MIAKDGILYALIENGEVVQIFDSEQLREWDENTLKVVELKSGQVVELGMKYDDATNQFLDKTLQEVKEDLIAKINFFFEREVSYMQGSLTQNEIASFETQKREAENLSENPQAQTPLLSELAKQRNEDIKTLAQKVLTKNALYTERLAKLLGYKQSLIKRVENAQTRNELDEIKYISPLNKEN